MKEKRIESGNLSRRRFLKNGAAAAGAAWAVPNILPSRVWAQSPNDKIQVGLIGCGGIARGQATYRGDRAAVAGVCDVWNERRMAFKERYGNCPDYVDFRELLSRSDIDAVHVSTPDHWHVPMAILAAEAGKHMVIEKPFSMSVGGLLAARRAIEDKDLVFQLHAESRSNRRAQKFMELAVNGFAGEIREAFIWGPGGSKNENAPREQPLPEGWGNYDLWLGPAPEAPYSAWRTSCAGVWNMSDYSLGMLTNWGIHPVNMFQWWADVMELGVPVEYEGETEMNPAPAFHNVTEWDVVLRYAGGFEARFMSIHRAAEHAPPGFDAEMKSGPAHGVTLIGEKGWLHWNYQGITGSQAPYEDLMRTRIESPTREFVKSRRGHNDNFIDAVLGIQPATADFPSTFRSDMIPVLVDLMGRTECGKIKWDPVRHKVLDCPDAQAFLIDPMREPWGSAVYKYLES